MKTGSRQIVCNAFEDYSEPHEQSERARRMSAELSEGAEDLGKRARKASTPLFGKPKSVMDFRIGSNPYKARIDTADSPREHKEAAEQHRAKQWEKYIGDKERRLHGVAADLHEKAWTAKGSLEASKAATPDEHTKAGEFHEAVAPFLATEEKHKQAAGHHFMAAHAMERAGISDWSKE